MSEAEDRTQYWSDGLWIVYDRRGRPKLRFDPRVHLPRSALTWGPEEQAEARRNQQPNGRGPRQE